MSNVLFDRGVYHFDDCFFGGLVVGRGAVVAAVGEEFSECWMFD